MAFTIITGGSFTSTGVNVNIPLPANPDYFMTWNMTQYAATNPNTVVQGQWFGTKFGSGASAAGLGLQTVKTTAMLTSNFGAGLGFYYVTVVPYVEAQAANAITAITAANPAVVSQTNTYNNGDLLRIYNTTGDLTIGGMVFQISSVSGSGYTLSGLANVAGNGLAAATAGNTRRVSQNAAVDPEYMYVTNVTNANPCVVSLSIDPTNYYVVGNKVKFYIPASFGMTDLNTTPPGFTNDFYTITAISNSTTNTGNVGAYTVTLNVDSTNFGTFTFPSTTLSPTTTLFAMMVPAGSSTQYNTITKVQTGYEFQKTPFHTGQFTPYMTLIGGAQSPAGANNDVINWMAYKLEN